MAQFDYIMSSLTSAWNAGGHITLMPQSSIYYGRAQKPDELTGFPYAECDITIESTEQRTKVQTYGSLVTYRLEIAIWTAQGQTGGATSGDQVTDQGNLMRAFESVLDLIPPNLPWNYVTNFLHCLKESSSLEKDEELYLGKDVLISRQSWLILVAE